MAKKVALGKGIASLIQETPKAVVGAQVIANEEKNDRASKQLLESGPVMISVDDIKPNPHQPRKIFKEKEILELSASIKENGVIQPIIVTKSETGFELIAGERRLKAAKRAELKLIPAIVKRATEKDKVVMAIIENIQRSDLNCVEEGLAYYQLMTDYKLTQEEVAKKLGKERSTIANYLRILKLPRQVIELLQREELSFGHAKLLAGIDEREKAIRLANLVVEEKMSVRDLEKEIKKKRSLTSEKEYDSELESLKEKMDSFRSKLESKTGFHFNLKNKKNGAGQFILNFSNEAEFNDIYEWLMKR